MLRLFGRSEYMQGKLIKIESLKNFHCYNWIFSTFSLSFLISIFFSNLSSKCSNVLTGISWKSILFQGMYWHFTVRINCSSDLKHFINSQPSALNFKSFSSSIEHFFSLSRSELRTILETKYHFHYKYLLAFRLIAQMSLPHGIAMTSVRFLLVCIRVHTCSILTSW